MPKTESVLTCRTAESTEGFGVFARIGQHEQLHEPVSSTVGVIVGASVGAIAIFPPISTLIRLFSLIATKSI